MAGGRDHEAALAAFEAWLRESGCSAALVALRRAGMPEEGVSAALAEDAQAGQELLSVPAALLLDHEAALAWSAELATLLRDHALVDDLRAPQAWPVILLLAVLAEERGLLRGEQGRERERKRQAWHSALGQEQEQEQQQEEEQLLQQQQLRRQREGPGHGAFLDMLPRSGIAPSSRQLRALLGPEHPLCARAAAREREVDEFFVAKDVHERLGVSLDALRWAHAVFWSRALVVPLNSRGKPVQTHAVVPLLDSLNHRPGALQQLEAAGVGTEARLVLRAGHAVGSGEPLVINYGAKANAELLLHYGFCLPTNAADYVELQVAGRAFRFHGAAAAHDSFPEGLLDWARRAARAKSAGHSTAESQEPESKRVRLEPVYRPWSELERGRGHDEELDWDWMNPEAYNCASALVPSDGQWLESCGLGTVAPTADEERAALELVRDALERERELRRLVAPHETAGGADEELIQRYARIAAVLLDGEVACIDALDALLRRALALLTAIP